MSHKNFEKTDNAENVEQVEKPDKMEGKEKEGILAKAKNFFAEHGKNKEGEGKEKETQEKDANENDDKKQEGKPSWELSPEEKSKVNENTKKVVDEYREKNGLDEHGNKIDGKSEKSENNDDNGDEEAHEHGEDGERTRYSDMKAAQYKDNQEHRNEEDDLER